jgi:hypothetical protein
LQKAQPRRKLNSSTSANRQTLEKKLRPNMTARPLTTKCILLEEGQTAQTKLIFSKQCLLTKTNISPQGLTDPKKLHYNPLSQQTTLTGPTVEQQQLKNHLKVTVQSVTIL